jgi:hypothetical protein
MTVPLDLETLKIFGPIILGLWTLILLLWSFVEQPLRRVRLEAGSDFAFQELRRLIDAKGFQKVADDEGSKRIRVKGTLKIVDVILWRCWTKEIIFHVTNKNSSSELLVSGKISPFRATASRKRPDYFSYELLDEFLNELITDLGGQVVPIPLVPPVVGGR